MYGRRPVKRLDNPALPTHTRSVAHNGDVVEEEMEALGPLLEHLVDSLGHHLSLGDQLTGIKHGLRRTRGGRG